jgi:short-subunit dehydrogenase
LPIELEGTGVTVTALCPGGTHTDFIAKAGMEDVRLFQSGVMDAVTVAQAGYQASMNNKRVVIPGFGNKAMIFAVKFSPGKMVTRVGRSIMGKV